jgi:hypothetical protein
MDRQLHLTHVTKNKWSYVPFRKMDAFYGEELVALRSSPKLEDQVRSIAQSFSWLNSKTDEKPALSKQKTGLSFLLISSLTIQL